jgi:hypothetical protein
MLDLRPDEGFVRAPVSTIMGTGPFGSQREEDPMRHVDAACYTGLIVPAPSGVVWYNQTHGCACYHPELEGVLIPLAIPRALSDYMYRRGELGPLTEAESDKIDEILRVEQLPLCCARDMIGEAASSLAGGEWSGEAWLWVESAGKEHLMGLADFGRVRGVLTWTNSD